MVKAMRLHRSQRGLAAAAIVIVLILAAVALILGRGYFRSEAILDQRGVTDANMRRISDALVAYASLNQRLPCPARGDDALLAAAEIGKADPENATTITTPCGTPDGVVPWKTIALSRNDALDGWGRKISYRVFSGSGNIGFTQVNGVNMTNCNSSLGAPIDPALDSASLCKSGGPPPNMPSQFLGLRGNMLVVEVSLDTSVPSQKYNAFVLISHGESGYGAFLAEGATSRTTLPESSGPEYQNLLATGTYWSLPRSAPDVPASVAGHFDDFVTYMNASELIAKAGLGARPWSNFPLSATFSRSAVAGALGIPSGSLGDNTGSASLSLGGFLVTATSSAGAENVGFREQGGIGGIGVYSGGSDNRGDIDSDFNERLTFQLGSGSEYGKMDVALNRFQITDTGPPPQKERAEISFWRAGELVQTATFDSWDDSNDPTRCLFRLVTGGTFDRMDVAPVAQTNGGGNSRFTVAGIMACTDPTTPCATTVSGAVACPIPPPSAASNSATDIGTTTATLQGTVEDNGIAKGTGAGYRMQFFTTFDVGTKSIPLVSGNGTILAGNCITIATDPNTYVVASGINSPGTLRIADPGLLDQITPGFLGIGRAVTVTHCQTALSFEYGLTCALGTNATASPGTINAGSGSTNLSASISGLTCNTSYYFRTSATSPGGTTTGSNRSFTTANCPYPTPIATSNMPTNVSATSAMLNGVVNDNGAVTTVTFEYGLTSCYGSSIAATPGTISAGAGATTILASIGLSPDPPLACNTLYHYRVRAVSAAGTTTGNDTVFTTAACP